MKTTTLWQTVLSGVLALSLDNPAIARHNNPAITFSDIAAGDNAGIAYRRVPSTTFLDFLKPLQEESLLTPIPFPATAARPPMKPRGIPVRAGRG